MPATPFGILTSDDVARFEPRGDELYADDFGVVPGGVDQTSNFADAVAAAAALGRGLVVPPGTYTVSELSIPSGVSLSGFGGFTVLKRPPAAVSSRVLVIVGSGVQISNLTLDGNGMSGGGTSGQGVVETTGILAGDIAFRNVTVRDSRYHSFSLGSTSGRVSLTDCRAEDFGASGAGWGVNMISSTGGAPTSIPVVEISGCEFFRHAANTTGYGVGIRGSNDVSTRVMKHVRVLGNLFDLSNATTGLCCEVWAQEAVIEANLCLGGGFGISAGIEARNVIANNIIKGAGDIGIEATATATTALDEGVDKYTTCTGNLIVDCPTGIVSWSGIGQGVVTGNTIVRATVLPIQIAGIQGIATGNMLDCPGAPVGIQIGQGSDEVTLTGNQIKVDTTGTAMLVRNGVAGNVQHFAVTGNNVLQASIGVSITGTGGATATQDGTIIGNDLMRATTPVSIGGTTTKGQIARGFNTGDRLTVTGSRSGGAALTNLLAGLAARGLIIDSTTA